MNILADFRFQSGLAISTFAIGFAVYYFTTTNKSSTANKKIKSSTPKSQTNHSREASKPEVESTADILKGYKTTSDGRKTTYFNRELSEKEKELIGDIAPKPISSSPDPSVLKSVSPPPSGQSQSVWNAAGTWEETDHSKWANNRLRAILKGVTSKNFNISTVQSLEGDAAVTVSRGKRRFIYDYCAVVDWKGTVDGTAVGGELRIEEITSDKSYELHLKFTSADHQRRFSNHKTIKEFQHSIRSDLDKFLIEFQQV